MENISIRFGEAIIQDMEKIMRKNRYSTKTEFIREAIRDKIYDLEKKEALLRLEKVYGSLKRKTTDKQLHEAGERAFRKLEEKFGIK